MEAFFFLGGGGYFFSAKKECGRVRADAGQFITVMILLRLCRFKKINVLAECRYRVG